MANNYLIEFTEHVARRIVVRADSDLDVLNAYNDAGEIAALMHDLAVENDSCFSEEAELVTVLPSSHYDIDLNSLTEDE
jgi:hypothetical protein